MNAGGQFGDTTLTKVFVGGLAWETQKETVNKYFEQFGEILEAVVITDKSTGRSKGYGFVTFREADAAMRACADATPVIDGRRANCNLASMGVQRSKPSTPNHNARTRVMGGFHHQMDAGARLVQAAGLGSNAAFASYPAHYSIQQGIPYNLSAYGYSPYSADYSYPPSYYGAYGGGNVQYASYGSNAMLSTGGSIYFPYLNMSGQGVMTSGGSAGHSGSNIYGVPQYAAAHHHLLHYPPITSTAQLYSPQLYGVHASPLASPLPRQSGVAMMALHAQAPHR